MNIHEIINVTLNGKGDSDQHLITLFAIALSIKAKSILELGVRDGLTTGPLLEACRILNGNLTSVDICNTNFKPNSTYNKYWKFIQSDALLFLEQNKQIYDMIYIDDWHASEHVYKELTLLKPYTSPHTLILLHDLMHSNNQPHYNQSKHTGNEWEGTGPYGGVIKFILDNPNYEFATIPVNHGLTILRKIK